MKKIASALVVFAIVGGALAFKTKAFLPGNIYCTSTTPVSTETCASQLGTAAPFQTVTNGSSGNPCTGTGVNPYFTPAGTTTCVALGTQEWAATLHQ
jgi:hypothetical protein